MWHIFDELRNPEPHKLRQFRRRLMWAQFALDSIDAANFSLTIGGNATKNVTGFQNPVTGTINDTEKTGFTLGTGAGNCNEIISVLRTLAASGTDSMDLQALADICNNTPVVLTSIVGISITLVSVAQDATNGTACSAILLGAAGTNPWTGGPLGAADTYKIRNGERWAAWTEAAAGWTVGGTNKVLKIVNQDGAVAAAYRVTIFGRA